jgi:hypothetical protein
MYSLRHTSIALALVLSSVVLQAARPNFIIIFTDDQGYEDLGCFGSQLAQGLERIDPDD